MKKRASGSRGIPRRLGLWSVLLLAIAALVAGCGGGSKSTSGSTTSASSGGEFTAALISDIGKFTDKGFNQNQLKGLKFAQAHIKGLTTSALESRSASEYLPNFASLATRAPRS